ncbi:MAG: ankyrin repeat domain-containing protein [Treponema sp.]|nr:ankyrin repeat domain-containing protein [Treponema sp.]
MEKQQKIGHYIQAFSETNEIEKKALYFFLGIGHDNPVSVKEIRNKIRESGKWKKIPAQNKLEKALDTLSNFHILKANRNKSAYKIESIPFRNFLFAEEFLHFNPEKKDFMRDTFVDLNYQLKKALEYDLDNSIIEPLLERMKENNILIDKELFLTACSLSSKHAVFSLLKDYGCDPYLHDKYGKSTFYYAILTKNIIALDWLLNNAEKELLNRTFNEYFTVFHYAVSIATFFKPYTNVLKWLWEHAEKGLLNRSDNDGKTVFHRALMINTNTKVLDWLWEHAEKELLNRSDNDGKTVFHCAVIYHNPDTKILDWLLCNAEKKLIDRSDNDGKTAFDYAIEDENTDIINWFFA